MPLNIPPQPQISRRRYLINPGFEQDLLGWVFTPGEVFVDAAEVFHGIKSARIQRVGSPGNWGALYQEKFPITQGVPVHVSGYGKGNNVQQSHVKITWYDAAGVGITNTQVAPGGTDGTWDWTFFEAEMMPHEDAVSGEFAVMGGWSPNTDLAYQWVDNLDVWTDDYVEGPYSEVEMAWIEEQPERFPTNQNSNWGQVRKIASDELQKVADEQTTIWRNKFLPTADELLHMWEEMVGLPINPPLSSLQRIAEIKSRLFKGPFTRTQRHEIVHGFIEATMGAAPQLTEEGLELTGDGIILMADPVVDIMDHHVIIEDVENFSYNVGVDRALGVDLIGLERELLHYTPAHIQLVLTEDYFKEAGAISAASGGMTIDRTDL